MSFPAAHNWGVMKFDAHLGCLLSISDALGLWQGQEKATEPTPGFVIRG